LKFIQESSDGNWTVAELERRHGISRKTACQFLDRFAEEDVAGLDDWSQARHAMATTDLTGFLERDADPRQAGTP